MGRGSLSGPLIEVNSYCIQVDRDNIVKVAGKVVQVGDRKSTFIEQ